MTKAKKILSVVVALVLAFSMVTTIASAAIADGKKAAFILTADNLTVEAGSTITITLSAEVNSDFEDYAGEGIGNTCAMLAYDSSKVDIHEDVKAATPDDALTNSTVYMEPCDGVDYSKDYSSSFASGMFEQLLLCAEGYEDDYAAKGWNSAVASILIINTNLPSGSDICKFKFTVADDVEPGTKFTIGIPEGCLYDGNFNTYASLSDVWESDIEPCYDLSQAELEFTVASAAEPSVSHEMYMGRMDNWDDATATKFDAGFVGRITNLDPSFDADGESQAIESIVVNITRDGKTLSGKAHQLYAQDDGSYLFRAVVLGANISDDVNITYEYIVTLTTDADGDGQNDTVTYSSTDEDLSFKAIHAEANGRRPA